MVCDARFFRYFMGGGGELSGVEVGFQNIWFCFVFPRLFKYFMGGG